LAAVGFENDQIARKMLNPLSVIRRFAKQHSTIIAERYYPIGLKTQSGYGRSAHTSPGRKHSKRSVCGLANGLRRRSVHRKAIANNAIAPTAAIEEIARAAH
jgi:hypothetical protein